MYLIKKIHLKIQNKSMCSVIQTNHMNDFNWITPFVFGLFPVKLNVFLSDIFLIFLVKVIKRENAHGLQTA